MTERELEQKIERRQALKRMLDQVSDEIATVEDEIKAEMGDRESMTVGVFKVTWKNVVSKRLDTKAIKNAFAEAVLAPFMVATASRRFDIR